MSGTAGKADESGPTQLRCPSLFAFSAVTLPPPGLQCTHDGWSPAASLDHEAPVEVKACLTRIEKQKTRRGLDLDNAWSSHACLGSPISRDFYKEVTFLFFKPLFYRSLTAA